MPLSTYNNLKEAVLNRRLINKISSFDPVIFMPFGGQRLPQSQLNKIITWKDTSFPE
jgi:hypothetical protein